MAGVIQKIGEALHMGGGEKKEDEHKAMEHHGVGGEHKQGMMDKIKEKMPGGQTAGSGHDQQQKYHGGDQDHELGMMEKIKEKIPGAGAGGEGEKKKKKRDKKKHDDGGHSSSSSDSD